MEVIDLRIVMNNTTLKSDTMEYEIINEYARGSSCIVYKGKYYDSGNNVHSVLIKELYPIKLQASIKREHDDRLKVTEAIQRNFDNHVKDFYSSYVLQNSFREENGTINVTSSTLDCFSSNNTLYLVMGIDEGESLAQKIETMSIKDISESLLSLAKVIKIYHERGFIHLDIKPDNVFVISEISNMIKLFDFDAVVNLDDIKSRKAKLSASNGYAANEVLQWHNPARYKTIGIVSDIYSIGALMFRYVMKKLPSSFDIKIDSEYIFDFQDERFKNINPKIFWEIKELFIKTIKAVPEYRYQTDEELITQLEKIVEFSDPKEQFLISNFKASEKFFIGRDENLKEIDTVLEKKNCVVLRGIGGIGKTSLILKYAELNMNKFDTIIFAQFNGSLKRTICDDTTFKINNFGKPKDFKKKPKQYDKYFNEKIEKLKETVTNRTLIIIDAFDEENDADLSKILRLNCKFIISSRYDQAHASDNFTQININEISNIDDAFKLFSHYYKRKFNDDFKEKIYKIIQKIESHTITIELLARSLSSTASHKESEIIVDDFLKDKSFVYAKEEINYTKDGKSYAHPAEKIISKIFKVSKLSDKEKYVLRCMTLSPDLGIDKEYIKNWCGLKNCNVMNNLIRRGWILADSDNIRLHKVISDALFKKLEPNTVKCYNFIANIIDENLHTYEIEDLYLNSLCDKISYQNILSDDEISILFRKTNPNKRRTIDDKFSVFEDYYRLKNIFCKDESDMITQGVYRICLNDIVPLIAIRDLQNELKSFSDNTNHSLSFLIEDIYEKSEIASSMSLETLTNALISLRLFNDDGVFKHRIKRDYFASVGIKNLLSINDTNQVYIMIESISKMLEYRNSADIPRRTKFLDVADFIYSSHLLDSIPEGIEKNISCEKFLRELSGVYDDLSDRLNAPKIGLEAYQYLTKIKQEISIFEYASNLNFLYYTIKHDVTRIHETVSLLYEAKNTLEDLLGNFNHQDYELNYSDIRLHALYGKVLSNIGSYHYQHANSDKALKKTHLENALVWHNKSLEYREKFVKHDVASSYRTIMSDLFFLEKHEESYDYYIKALTCLDKKKKLSNILQFKEGINIPIELVERALGSQISILKSNKNTKLITQIKESICPQIKYVFRKNEVGRTNLDMRISLINKINQILLLVKNDKEIYANLLNFCIEKNIKIEER